VTLGDAKVDGDVDGPAVLGRGASVAMGASVAGSVIGAGAAVLAGATVRDSVLLPGVVVGEGAVVSRSIIGRGATVGRGAEVTNLSVLGAGYEVEPGAYLDVARVPGQDDG